MSVSPTSFSVTHCAMLPLYASAAPIQINGCAHNGTGQGMTFGAHTPLIPQRRMPPPMLIPGPKQSEDPPRGVSFYSNPLGFRRSMFSPPCYDQILRCGSCRQLNLSYGCSSAGYTSFSHLFGCSHKCFRSSSTQAWYLEAVIIESWSAWNKRTVLTIVSFPHSSVNSR
jgi:hypothetical protein